MAYAGARLGAAVLSGLTGCEITECAYVESSVVPGLDYFVSKVVLSGTAGIAIVHPIGWLNAHEQKRLEDMTPILRKNRRETCICQRKCVVALCSRAVGGRFGVCSFGAVSHLMPVCGRARLQSGLIVKIIHAIFDFQLA